MLTPRNRTSVLLSCAAAAAVSSTAWGQLVFDAAASSVSFRHTEDAGTTTLRRSTRAFFFNDPALANSLDFSNLFSISSTSTTGKAGVDPITNSTTGSFRLPGGTGVAQINPSPRRYLSYSEVQISLDMRWTVGPAGSGSALAPYSSFGIAGSVGTGTGAFARLIQSITVQNLSDTNAVLRTASLDADVNITAPGAFSQPVTRSSPWIGGSGALAAGTRLVVSGTVKFRARNDGSPTDIELLDGELGGNADLYTGNFGLAGSWQDAANWLPSTDLPPATFPNGPVRARLVATDLTTDLRTITLNAPVTVDSLEVDDVDSHTFNPATPLDGLTIGGEKPLLLHGNANGNGTLIMNSPVAFAPLFGAGDAAIRSNSTGGLTLAGPLNAGSATTLTMEGSGPIRVTSNNVATLNGPVVISGQAVTTTVSGALGSGPLTISNGLLTAVTANPSTDPGPAVIVAGGQYTMAPGFLPAPGETFAVNNLSGISGTPAQLNALSVGGNLNLAPGAMVIHRTFTPLVAPGQDVQGLGTVPQYVYGLGTNFTAAGSLGINSAGATPYMGFGVDRAVRTFGDHPNPGDGPSTTSSVLSMSGTTVLAALPTGQLILNRQLGGTGMIDVSGGGIVTLNNASNSFAGTIRIQPNSVLEVNGILSPSVLLDVQGTLAGRGEPVLGNVTVNSGGVVSPGGPGRGFLRMGQLQLAADPEDARLRFTVNTPDSSDFIFVQGGIGGQATVDLSPGPNFDAGIYELMAYTQNSPPTALNSLTVPPDFQAELALVPRPGLPGGRAVLVVSPVGVDVGSWNTDNNLASYTDPLNWNGPVPNAPSAVANFGPIITGQRFVLLESPVTLGTVNVFTDHGYAIATNGGGSMTISGVLDQAGFNVSGGDVNVFVPVHFQSSPRIGGTGDLNFFGAVTADPDTRLTKYGGGPMRMMQIRFDELRIDGGIAEIIPNPAGPNSIEGASKLRSLILANETPQQPNTSGTVVSTLLDVGNNALILDYEGASPIDTIRQMLQRGYGSGNWTTGGAFGPAIGSRTLREHYAMPSIPQLQSLALVEAGDLGLPTFAGQSCDSTSLIIAYTLSADTNLDFVINLDDFTALAAQFGQPGGWADGDFNFDALVNLDDFTVLAANFGQALLGGVPRPAAVPEPASAALLAGAALFTRRRRA